MVNRMPQIQSVCRTARLRGLQENFKLFADIEDGASLAALL
jgi:hypothetical protein